MSWLGLTLVVPLSGAAVAALSRGRPRLARAAAFLVAFATLGLCLVVWARFDRRQPGYQLVDSFGWAPPVGASFLVGVDGLSLYLLVLTALLVPLLLVSEHASKAPEGYLPALLLLEAALLGAWVSLDVLLFFSCWVVASFALCLLVAMGEGPRAWRAALRGWSYLVGAGCLFLGVVVFCHELHEAQSGSPSFDARLWSGLVLTPRGESWLFLLSLMAFAVVVPLFPLPSWRRRSMAPAPRGAKILAWALTVKLGVYGMLRFAVPWFARAAHTYAPFIGVVALASVLVGGGGAARASHWDALASRLTTLYMGLAVAGIFALDGAALQGALLLLIGHGLLITALVLLGGRLGATEASASGGAHQGVWRVAPFGTAGLCLLCAFAVAWPLWITARASGVPLSARLAVIIGLALLAVGFSRLLRPAFRAPATAVGRRNGGLRRREALVLLPLVAGLLGLSLWPHGVADGLEAAGESFLSHLSAASVLEELP